MAAPQRLPTAVRNRVLALAGLSLPLAGCRGLPEDHGRSQSGYAWNHYLLGAAYYRSGGTKREWAKDFRQMEELGFNAVRVGEFARLGPRLAGAVTQADVAMLYDFTNEWSQGFWGSGRGYDSDAERNYRGLKVLQRNIDVVPPTAELSGYKLVSAPNLRLVDDATVERLRAFVAAGGVLVLNLHAGTQNPDNSMRRVLPPGPFAALAGVTAVSELAKDENRAIRILDAKLNAALGIVFNGSPTVFAPRTVLEDLRLDGATPVATFRSGRMAGRPAVTRHAYQRGYVFYAGTDSGDAGFYETLAREAAAAVGLAPLLEVPRGVEVTTRETPDTTYYFLLNYTEDRRDIRLPQPLDELVSQKPRVTEVSLAPLGVAVLAGRRS